MPEPTDNNNGSSKTRIAIALIAAASAVLVAVIQFSPAVKPTKPSDSSGAVAGRVVDIETNAPIPGAELTVAGRTEVYVTEDNGNFRLLVRQSAPEAPVRVQISKLGYQSADRSFVPPVENTIIQLRRKR